MAFDLKFENADNNDGTKKLYELLYPIVAMHPGSDAEAITFDNIANVANNDTLTSINAAIRGDNKQNGQVFIIGDGIFLNSILLLMVVIRRLLQATLTLN